MSSPIESGENITKDTKGVIIVHIGGLVSPQIKEIQEICQTHELFP
ncbi:DegT/DnrJ/EryC1/StrS family aminotransferase [Chloroflexota bacterium]